MQYPPLGVTTPRLQLKGFAKTRTLAPGESDTLTITLDKYAASFWDTEEHTWHVTPGDYHVFAGTSSADLPLSGKFKIENGFDWSGL